MTTQTKEYTKEERLAFFADDVLQSLVHLADYLASRRYLDFNFEKKNG